VQLLRALRLMLCLLGGLLCLLRLQLAGLLLLLQPH
jgi:hypothetical protein